MTDITLEKLRDTVIADASRKKTVKGEFLSNGEIREIDNGFKTIKTTWRDDAIEEYEKALDKSNSFPRRLKHFLLAQNKSGRRAKVVKDFVLLFTPYGRQIADVTELVTEVLSEGTRSTTKQTLNKTHPNMRIIEWLQKRLKERSTRAALTLVASLAVFFGLDLEVVQLEAAISAVLQAASALVAAAAVLYEMFRQEDKDEK